MAAYYSLMFEEQLSHDGARSVGHYHAFADVQEAGKQSLPHF